MPVLPPSLPTAIVSKGRILGRSDPEVCLVLALLAARLTFELERAHTDMR